MKDGDFFSKIKRLLLNVTKLHRHVFENPGYTECPFLTNIFHRIPINVKIHTDFGIDSILIIYKKHTVNGIILLHKFFLPNIFFLTSFLCTIYSSFAIFFIINNFFSFINIYNCTLQIIFLFQIFDLAFINYHTFQTCILQICASQVSS